MVVMRRNGPNALQLALDRIARVNYGVLWNEVLNDLGGGGRKGPAVLGRILALHEQTPPTDSGLEVRFLQLNRRFDLPVPMRQVVIRDQDGSVARVDFVYLGTNLIVEVDDRSIHARRRQWEKDLRRHNRLTAQWLSRAACHLRADEERPARRRG
jgi:hypothetical protein